MAGIGILCHVSYTLCMAESSTISINISLPEPLKRFVDGKVATGMYGSASEFVREAIREKLGRDQARAEASAALTANLIEGLDSGKGRRVTAAYIEHKKRKIRTGAGKSSR